MCFSRTARSFRRRHAELLVKNKNGVAVALSALTNSAAPGISWFFPVNHAVHVNLNSLFSIIIKIIVRPTNGSRRGEQLKRGVCRVLADESRRVNTLPCWPGDVNPRMKRHYVVFAVLRAHLDIVLTARGNHYRAKGLDQAKTLDYFLSPLLGGEGPGGGGEDELFHFFLSLLRSLNQPYEEQCPDAPSCCDVSGREVEQTVGPFRGRSCGRRPKVGPTFLPAITGSVQFCLWLGFWGKAQVAAVKAEGLAELGDTFVAKKKGAGRSGPAPREFPNRSESLLQIDRAGLGRFHKGAGGNIPAVATPRPSRSWSDGVLVLKKLPWNKPLPRAKEALVVASAV